MEEECGEVCRGVLVCEGTMLKCAVVGSRCVCMCVCVSCSRRCEGECTDAGVHCEQGDLLV